MYSKTAAVSSCTARQQLVSPDSVVNPLQVRFSSPSNGTGGKRPPTAVMVHGILGNRRNMHAFAKRLSEVSPCPQVQPVAVSTSLHCICESPEHMLEVC